MRHLTEERSARAAVERFQPGFFNIHDSYLPGPETAAGLVERMQQSCRIPAIVCLDVETGLGQQIVEGVTEFPTNMGVGVVDDENITRQYGAAVARECRTAGFHLAYGPVVDLNRFPECLTNTRSFGPDAGRVARLGASYVAGAQANGLICTAKHFYHSGMTASGERDGHMDLVEELDALEEIRDRELLPYRYCIDAGVEAVMTCHSAHPKVDPEGLPGTLSPRIVGGLLRGELGFQGLVIPDSLTMGAISRHFPPEEAARRAFEAGVDCLGDPVTALPAMRTALEEGRISLGRLDASVRRVLHLKEKYGLLDGALRGNLHKIDFVAHRELADELARRSVIVVKNETRLIPLEIGKRRIAVVEVKYPAFLDMANSVVQIKGETLGHILARSVPDVTWIELPRSLPDEAVTEAVNSVSAHDLVVFVTYIRYAPGGSILADPKQVRLCRRLKQGGKKVVVVVQGSPYAFDDFRFADAFVLAYGGCISYRRALADVLLGTWTPGPSE
jgi:beta-N-acetylhexosaminidase